MNRRPCDDCADTKHPGMFEWCEGEPLVVCGMCDGTTIIDDVCYCHAYEPEECCCNADWSDYIYLDWDEN